MKSASSKEAASAAVLPVAAVELAALHQFSVQQ
jgi:hypothetical protein